VRIAVCRPQQPFVRGGAEIFVDKLVSELQARGHETDVVSVPLSTWPNPRLLSSALMWRFVDLRAGGSSPADLVIATKFPSYLIDHPNKVVWLLHQLRQAYELDGTDFGQFGPSPFDRAIRDRIEAADRFSIGQARRVFATSSNVAGRLKRSTGIDAEVLPHPPQELDFRCDGYGSFVLSVGRLDPLKRVDLLLHAAALEPRLEAVVAGDGPDRARLEALSGELGLDGRVRFAGRVSEAELTDLYAACRAVYYAPVDEDFGMVPIEAYRSGKPVVTTTDAGGPLDFVRPGSTGWVVEPDAAALAGAFAEMLDGDETVRRYGEAGGPAAAAITWDGAIERLLGS
jgi:glycosyltransferase involved in cell wall biosynthesis